MLRNNWKPGVAPIISLGLFCVTLAAFAKQEAPVTTIGQRTLTTTGVGAVSLKTDIARVSLTITTEDKDLSRATEGNSLSAERALQVLGESGVASEDIKTENFNIYPRTDWGPNGENRGIIYSVQHQFSVTVRQLDRLGRILDPVLEVDASISLSIRLDVDDKSGPFAEALTAAVQDARNKAALMAEAAGVTLGNLLSLQSYVGGIPVPAGAADERAFAESLPIAPGQTEITTQVLAVYEIK